MTHPHEAGSEALALEARRIVLEAVARERDRQYRKFGDQNHRSDTRFNLILSEEAGEAAKEVDDEECIVRLYKEIIETAAVAVAWAENVLMRGPEGKIRNTA